MMAMMEASILFFSSGEGGDGVEGGGGAMLAVENERTVSVWHWHQGV